MNILEHPRHGEHHHPHLVTTHIHVNRHPVVLEGKLATGLQIKHRAIASGVPIQLNFQLLLEPGHSHQHGEHHHDHQCHDRGHEHGRDYHPHGHEHAPHGEAEGHNHRPNGNHPCKAKVIGDHEEVVLHDGQCFVALAPDDNS